MSRGRGRTAARGGCRTAAVTAGWQRTGARNLVLLAAGLLPCVPGGWWWRRLVSGSHSSGGERAGDGRPHPAAARGGGLAARRPRPAERLPAPAAGLELVEPLRLRHH